MVCHRFVFWTVVAAACAAAGAVPTTAHAQRRSGGAATPPSPSDSGSDHLASAARGLHLRSIGPALISGRVSDLAVHPTDKKVWYVATASGGLWKTNNAGTTWSPIFDNEASYSIANVELDPKNPNVVWVGTGENNAQ